MKPEDIKAIVLKMRPPIGVYGSMNTEDEQAEKDILDDAKQVVASFEQAFKQAEKDLGWISVKDRLPEERKYESDTLQGHHEWTESDRVFVLDDRGVAMVDALRNGKFWLDGKKDCDGFPHYIEYWMPIPELPKEEEQ